MLIILASLNLLFRKQLVWFFSFIGVMLVACQSATPITPTPTEVSPTIETSEPTAQAESTVTTMVTAPILPLTPTQTATLIPIPTPTKVDTNTPTPTPTVLQKIGEIPIHGHRLAISSDGTTVAAMDNTSLLLSVFDTERQELKWQYEKDGYGFTTLSISPNGNLLAGGGVEQQVLVFDMFNGDLIYELSIPYIKIERLSFSPDSRLLAVSSIESDFDAGIMVWNMETGQLTNTFSSSNVITYLQSSGNERILEAFWEWYIGEAIFVPNQNNLLAFTLNIYSEEEGEQGALYFWDLDSQEITEGLTDSFDSRSIAVSPNGQSLVADMGGQLRAWDFQDRVEISELSVEAVEIARLALTDTGILAVLDRQGVVTVWKLTGELLAKLETDKVIDDVAFTSDNQLLIAYFVEDDDAPIEVWKINE